LTTNNMQWRKIILESMKNEGFVEKISTTFTIELDKLKKFY